MLGIDACKYVSKSVAQGLFIGDQAVEVLGVIAGYAIHKFVHMDRGDLLRVSV